MPAWLLHAACYAAATATAWFSDDVQEIAVESVCLVVLLAYTYKRRERGWLWIATLVIAAFVLFHERLHVRHWIAYVPAAASLVMAWLVTSAGSTRRSR
jgi:hypothetical protein